MTDNDGDDDDDDDDNDRAYDIQFREYMAVLLLSFLMFDSCSY